MRFSTICQPNLNRSSQILKVLKHSFPITKYLFLRNSYVSPYGFLYLILTRPESTVQIMNQVFYPKKRPRQECPQVHAHNCRKILQQETFTFTLGSTIILAKFIVHSHPQVQINFIIWNVSITFSSPLISITNLLYFKNEKVKGILQTGLE